MQLISYDPSGVFDIEHGISRKEVDELGDRLDVARSETLADRNLVADAVPPEKQPLDAAFIDLPRRLLDDYEATRDNSELGRIITCAKRLREGVDKVIVLGIGGSSMGARALMDACCPPLFNELSRGERAGCPRMYFAGDNLDNDATQALMSFLTVGRNWSNFDDRWAVVPMSKSGGTLETAVATRSFIELLERFSGEAALSDYVVPVTGESGKLRNLAQTLGCQEVFPVPDGVGGRFSVFSAVGLLPAALLGLDIVSLLKGAVVMNDHFENTRYLDNAVLQYVATCHLLETRRRNIIRVLSVWSNRLQSIGFWYDQLLAESLGKELQGATPITAVNTRDLHSRAQQHQEGALDKLITNVIVDQWRDDPVTVAESERNEDELNKFAGKSMPEMMSAAVDGTNQAFRDAGRPTADIHLPTTGEFHIGQLLQMLMLATVVEGRLMGINPYGQPGVEAYKTNMMRILDRPT